MHKLSNWLTLARTLSKGYGTRVPFSLQLFWHEAAYKRYQRHQNTMYFLSCMAKQPMNNTLTANKFIREVIWCSERGALLQVVLVCETIVYYGASK